MGLPEGWALVAAAVVSKSLPLMVQEKFDGGIKGMHRFYVLGIDVR